MTNPYLALESVSFVLPDGRTLFSDLTEQFDQQATGLVGRNGVGKSVLAQILAGELMPSTGRCLRSGRAFYLAQKTSYENYPSVAALAGVQSILDALARIEAGSTDPADFETVGERWDIRQQLRRELDLHGLGHVDMTRPVTSLSGGEAMRVALISAYLADADLLILDEPTNHLDRDNRRALTRQLRSWSKGLIVISHDRELLEQMPRIVELSSLGLRSYGGNYSFYAQQKNAESAHALRELEQLKLEKKREEQSLREVRERQEHRQSRNSKQARETNQAKILLGRQRERSEISSGKLHTQQTEVREQRAQRIQEAAQRIEQDDAIFVRPPDSDRPLRRNAVQLHDVELPFIRAATRHINLHVAGQQRVGVIGPNGCGKSTLLKTIAGHYQPVAGACDVQGPVAYLDQHLLSLDPTRSVLDHMQEKNRGSVAALRTLLAQLGLGAEEVSLPSGSLSGGERLKAALACALYADNPAKLLLLDEPSNHLDLASLRALENMLRQYQGALLVVSHDDVFLEQLNLTDYLCASEEGWGMRAVLG